MANDLTKLHAEKTLNTYIEEKLLKDEHLGELEQQGYRIVDVDQCSGPLDPDGPIWEVTDWRTGEVLLRGHGIVQDQEEDYARAVAEVDKDDRWFHASALEESLDFVVDVPPTEGLPDSLAEAIEGWIGALNSSNDDVAQWVGWSVEGVEKARGPRG